MNTKDMNYIGNQIKSARKRAGLTQRQLAERTSITNVWLCNVERGRRPVSLQTLLEVAMATDHVLKLSLVPKEKSR